MRTLALLAVGGLLSAASLASAQQAPLLRYGFDEAAGEAQDTGSAPPLPGQLIGGATRAADTPSGSGSAIDFRNEPPYAHVLGGDAAKLDGLAQLTLTTWLKLGTYTAGNNRLLAKQGGGANFDGFSFNMNAAPNDGAVGPDNFRLGMFLGGAGGFSFVYSDADADASQWAFIATTYDSTTGAVAFYTGGVNTPVSQLGTTQTLATNPGVIDGLGAAFGVGYTDAAPGADTSAIGLQDDVRVYGAALDLAALEAVRVSNIPEPASLAWVLLGSGAALARRRRA